MYLLIFLEGILAFISPCIVPMLPIYFMYLAGNTELVDKRRLLINVLGFILGFTLIFVSLGASATALGSVLRENKMLLQQLSGVVMIVFGLNFCGLVKIPFLNYEKRLNSDVSKLKFFSSVVFGATFSFGWTPCLSTFLGSALLLAANKASLTQGVLLLLVFSAGLAIPFLISAVIFEKLTPLLKFIKKHLKLVNRISGGFLIMVGLSLVFDVFGYWSALFY